MEPAPLRVMADDVRSAHPGRCVARFGRAPRTELHPEPQGRSFPFAPEHMDLVSLTLTLTLTLILTLTLTLPLPLTMTLTLARCCTSCS